MNKTQCLLMLAVLVSGCQTGLSLQREDDINTDDAILTKASLVDTTEVQNKFRYEIDHREWGNIIGLENRFRACEIPTSVLDSMTTEAMVKTVIEYPLNYILLAYENPQEAIDLIVDNSELHEKLIKRSDAADLLIEQFLCSLPSIGKNKGKSAAGEIVLPLEDYYFLGYFINSKHIQNYSDNERVREWRRLIREKEIQVEQNPDIYGELALEPIREVAKKLTAERSGGGVILGTINIQTPFLQTVVGQIISELNPDDVDYLDSLVVAEHPNATLIGHASACYNSHSYAWYLRSTSNPVWLPLSTPGYSYPSFQLNKYWTDDLYTSCTSTDAEIAYYPNGYFSAVVLANGKYRSKWERLPLMEHDPNDCPFVIGTAQYYREKPLPLLNDNVTIYGSDYVNPNVAYYYSITYPVGNNVNYYVTVESLNSGNTCSLTLQGGVTWIFSCSGYGAYKIYVRGYAGLNNCYYYSYKEKLIVCMPNKGATPNDRSQEPSDESRFGI